MASANNRVVFYSSSRLGDYQWWRWRLVARNGRIVAASSEDFTSRRDAMRNWLTLARMMKDRRLEIIDRTNNPL